MNKRLLLAWIVDCIEHGKPMPTDEGIAERYYLSGVEAARTLLADLADAGEITISGSGHDRTIALGKKKRPQVRVGRVEPPIKTSLGRQRPAPGARLDLIREIAEKRAAAKPITPMPERPEVETVEAQQEGRPDGQLRPASVDQGPRPACPPAQAVDEVIAPVKAPPQPVEARHPLPVEQFDPKPMPIRTGEPPIPPLLNKLCIPARVTSACIEDGRPLDEFLAALIDMGLQAWRQMQEIEFA
jgi:hypothetical protein